MDAEFTGSENPWRGNVRILEDYSGVVNSFNVIGVAHFGTSYSEASLPTHWTCPHHKNQEFILQGGTVEDILSRPGRTLTWLRSNDFNGIAFYGPSGVGKTQVAIRFIEKYRWHTYNVFWVNASTPTTIATDFQHTLDLFKNDVSSNAGTHTNSFDRMGGDALPFANPTDKRLPIPEDPRDQTAAMKNTAGSTAVNGQEDLFLALKSKLESCSTGSWILVLDNLTDETAVTEFLPKSPNGMIIVTTRSLHLASRLGCWAVEVPRMSPTNAVSLFGINYHNSEEPAVKQDEAMELMELLEHLPAKIVDAALHMSENRVSVKEHMAELKAAKRLAERGSMP